MLKSQLLSLPFVYIHIQTHLWAAEWEERNVPNVHSSTACTNGVLQGQGSRDRVVRDRGSSEGNAACDQNSFDSGYTCRFLGHILFSFPIPYTPQLSCGIQCLSSCLLFRKKTTLYQSPLVKNHIRMLLFACYQALLCCICSSTQLFICPFINTWILFLMLEPAVQHRLEKVSLLDSQLHTSAASRKCVSILFISA